MVEPKRVANIPEFVDLPENAIGKIREKFLDDLSYVRAAVQSPHFAPASMEAVSPSVNRTT